MDEVFHARFVEYAYPPHVHDAWTVFVVDDGAIRYDLETRRRGAGGGRVSILPPQVVHDGRPAGAAGFRKRVLYLDTGVLDERLTGRAVDEPDVREPGLLHAVHALHRALREPDDALEAEARLAGVGERLRAHLGERPPTGPGRAGGTLARSLRELLGGEPIAMVAAGVGFFDQAHFTRQFKRHVGVPPGRYARQPLR